MRSGYLLPPPEGGGRRYPLTRYKRNQNTMNDAVDKRIQNTDARHQVLRERGYDVQAMRARVVECARPVLGRVLDVGTGPGRLAILLAKEEGAPVTTLEFEGEGIQVAQRNAEDAGVGNRIRFLRGDAAHLPFPPGAFDLVASANLIHHMDEPALAMAEMVRVCKPGGRVVVADMTEAGLDLLSEVHREFGATHDTGPMNISEAVGTLDSSGLGIERWEEGLLVLFRIEVLS